jgi:hypothetical protein
MFVVDQREPLGTTLQPEVCPEDEVHPTPYLAPSPYLTVPRAHTFADRDHRRRVRLFEQLAPRAGSFAVSSTIDGQHTNEGCASGNGSMALLGWSSLCADDAESPSVDVFNGTSPDIDFDTLPHIGNFSRLAARAPPLGRGLSFAADEAEGVHFPTDIEELRQRLMLGNILPDEPVLYRDRAR